MLAMIEGQARLNGPTGFGELVDEVEDEHIEGEALVQLGGTDCDSLGLTDLLDLVGYGSQ